MPLTKRKITRRDIASVISSLRKKYPYNNYKNWLSIVKWQSFIVEKAIESFGANRENIFWQVWNRK